MTKKEIEIKNLEGLIAFELKQLTEHLGLEVTDVYITYDKEHNYYAVKLECEE